MFFESDCVRVLSHLFLIVNPAILTLFPSQRLLTFANGATQIRLLLLILLLLLLVDGRDNGSAVLAARGALSQSATNNSGVE